jgi:hypothetical protein
LEETRGASGELGKDFRSFGITFGFEGTVFGLERTQTGIVKIQHAKVFYCDAKRRTELLYVHFMGLKRRWHWLGFRGKCEFYRLSPIGYGGPAVAADLFRFPWREIWYCQTWWLLRAKSFFWSMLRQALPMAAFLSARR